MKQQIGLRGFVIIAICLASRATWADGLAMSDIAQRPEFWPAQCTIRKAIQFRSGQNVVPGQTVDVLEVHQSEAVLGSADGNLSFAVDPEDTDILARANALWLQLTPAQRALTYTQLLERVDLWPYRVTLTAPFDFGGARHTSKGDKAILIKREGNDLLVWSDALKTAFNVHPHETDLMQSARQLLVGSGHAAPGRAIEELQGKLIDSATGQAASFDASAPPRFIVFLHGRATCGYTQKFVPAMIQFEKSMKPKHSDFEIVYVRDDATVAEMQEFARKNGFAWRAVTAPELPVLGSTFSGGLPHVIVIDKWGNVVADGAGADSAPAALKRFESLLENPASIM